MSEQLRQAAQAALALLDNAAKYGLWTADTRKAAELLRAALAPESMTDDERLSAAMALFATLRSEHVEAALRFEEWNRAHANPPIEVGKESAVFAEALRAVSERIRGGAPTKETTND